MLARAARPAAWNRRDGKGQGHRRSGLTPYLGTAASFASMTGLTIGKFAAEGGVSVETVRFYQRRGLIALPDRRGSGFREYTEADQWRLAFIRRARQLGFTLAEIRDLLGPAGCRGGVVLPGQQRGEVDRRHHQGG